MVYRAWFLSAAILFVGCTGSAAEPDEASTQTSEPVEAIFDSEPPVLTPVEDETEVEDGSVVEPLRPYDDEPAVVPDDQIDTSVYITRVAMSATSIETIWSAHEGAVEYHLHRLPRTDSVNPATDLMTAENMIYVANDADNFVDEDVESDARYWYGLRALNADGVAIAHGWHGTAAVTDTEPPSLVGSLSAVLDGGEVLVSWTRPSENYELHGYLVSRSVNGGEFEPISTTWNLEQTTFIDDGIPASGVVSYEIVAIDFHWNKSDPAKVDVDLG